MSEWWDVPRAVRDEGNGEDVTELWAWVKTHGPGNESLASVMLPGAPPLPAVFATRRVADKVEPLMRMAQRSTGAPHRLVRFVRAEEP